MILDTFTYKELYSTLLSVYREIADRAHGFAGPNLKKLRGLCKNGEYHRPFYATIKNQRYRLGVVYQQCPKGVFVGIRALHTVISNNNRKLVIEAKSLENSGPTLTLLISVYTEHFLNRFCERSQQCIDDLPLLEKACLFYDNKDINVASSREDEIIRRHGEPSLEVAFLPKENRNIECFCFKTGDIAIVEKYDTIPVWRTYITEDMLFASQKNDTSYIETVAESVEIQDTEADKQWVPQNWRELPNKG